MKQKKHGVQRIDASHCTPKRRKIPKTLSNKNDIVFHSTSKTTVPQVLAYFISCSYEGFLTWGIPKMDGF